MCKLADAHRYPLVHFLCGALSCSFVYRQGGTNDNKQARFSCKRVRGKAFFQLIFWLFARILSGLFNLLIAKSLPESATENKRFYNLLFILGGGSIMWLFENHPKSLTNNLQLSMRYIYKQ